MEDVVSALAINPTGCNRVNVIFDYLAGENIHKVTEEEYSKYRWLMEPAK